MPTVLAGILVMLATLSMSMSVVGELEIHTDGEVIILTKQELAQISAEISGIPAEWILAQWKHETGNFTNWGATEAHNFAGLKKFRDNQPDWFDGDATSPEGDEYQVFENDEDFAQYFGRYLKMYEPDGLLESKTIREYAESLRRGGYYGDMPGMTGEESVDNYVEGLTKWL